MSSKNTIFYKQNQEYILNFSSEDISSDTSIFLGEKIERKHRLIRNISNLLDDPRDKSKTTHS